MARPIEDTPVLKGKDAERFVERLLTSDERKATKEEKEEVRKAYEAGMRVFVG